jgi:hypothetical protein
VYRVEPGEYDLTAVGRKARLLVVPIGIVEQRALVRAIRIHSELVSRSARRLSGEHQLPAIGRPEPAARSPAVGCEGRQLLHVTAVGIHGEDVATFRPWVAEWLNAGEFFFEGSVCGDLRLCNRTPNASVWRISDCCGDCHVIFSRSPGSWFSISKLVTECYE